MLVRKYYITNSSSCSFIAWGFSVERHKLDSKLEVGITEEEAEDLWEDLHNGKYAVSIKTCGYSGRAWIVISKSLVDNLEDEEYVELDPNVPPEWFQELGAWCDKYLIEREVPCWFFATVGC
jgi:hypothetical protein